MPDRKDFFGAEEIGYLPLEALVVDQTVTLTGIASAQAVGVPTVTTPPLLRLRAGAMNLGTGTSDIPVNGWGFAPEGILIYSTGFVTSDNEVLTNGMAFLIGMASRGNVGWSITGYAGDGLTTPVASGEFNAKIWSVGSAEILELVSFDPDGVTFHPIAPLDGNWSIRFVAWGGDAKAHAQVFALNQVTGPQIITTGTVDPAALVFLSDCSARAMPSGASASEIRIMLGAATGPSEEWCVLNGYEDGSPSVGTRGTYTDKCIAYADPATPNALDAAAELQSLGLGQFTLNVLDAAGGTNRYVACLALGNISAKAGVFTGPGSTADSVVTVPHTPKGVLLATANGVAANRDAIGAGNWEFSLGAMDGTRQGYIALGCEHNTAPSDTYCKQGDDDALWSMSGADGSGKVKLDYSAFAAESFTVARGISEAIDVCYLSFGDLSTAGPDQNVTPTGIGSGEAFGAVTITPGNVDVAVPAIASAQAVGVPRLDQQVAVTGIASAEALGVPVLVPGGLDVPLAGVASEEAVGVPTLTTEREVAAGGIESAEAFGVPTLVPGGVTVEPVGIESGEVFGEVVLELQAVDQTIDVAGIASAEAFGTVTFTTSTTVEVAGIPSGEAFGVPRLDTTINVVGIPSAEAVGAPLVGVSFVMVFEPGTLWFRGVSTLAVSGRVRASTRRVSTPVAGVSVTRPRAIVRDDG